MNIIKKLFGSGEDKPTQPIKTSDPFQDLPKTRMSQDKAVLTILRARKNTWVPLPVISEYTSLVCGSRCYTVHSRVAYLRKVHGAKIENYVDLINGQRYSYYKLIETNQ